MVTRLDLDNRVTSVEVDLSSFASVRAAARQISREVAHVDALINTAAVFASDYEQSDDGIELMLATNHLGPFLLTNLLRDKMAGGSRVITVTAPSGTRVDIEQLMAKDRFSALRTFGATKAANLMFTFELARRAKRWDVGAYAYHPGLVRSDLMREAPRPIRVLTRLVSRSPKHAGEDLAELATSPAFGSTTGWFFKGGHRIDPPKSTLDVEAQSNLWKRSAEIVELGETGF
jgi:NAD(P)-dependent dehydrogenase (short-subunit alcohol dehydrogenase family)